MTITCLFFFKRACQTTKKSACDSGQRSKHGLGLPILTKSCQILINIVLSSNIINCPFITNTYIEFRLFIIPAIQWRISLLTRSSFAMRTGHFSCVEILLEKVLPPGGYKAVSGVYVINHLGSLGYFDKVEISSIE